LLSQHIYEHYEILKLYFLFQFTRNFIFFKFTIVHPIVIKVQVIQVLKLATNPHLKQKLN